MYHTQANSLQSLEDTFLNIVRGTLQTNGWMSHSRPTGLLHANPATVYFIPLRFVSPRSTLKGEANPYFEFAIPYCKRRQTFLRTAS